MLLVNFVTKIRFSFIWNTFSQSFTLSY